MGNPKVIYKPVVTTNGKKFVINYYNKEEKRNQSFTVNRDNVGLAIALLPRMIANLASGEKPNIDPKSLSEAFDCNLRISPFHEDRRHIAEIADIKGVRDLVRSLIDDYSKPSSDGGTMITPDEQYKMMSKWHQWFKPFEIGKDKIE